MLSIRSADRRSVEAVTCAYTFAVVEKFA